MGRALIVSAGASSNEYISARLAELGYTRPTIIPSGAEARRRMLESDFELIVVNALAINSGMVCDGAKASCAAKIASSVEAGILGYHMYKNGQQFRSGDGIVTKGVENTIRNVGLLGREGMRETDKEIVRIMLQEP